MEEVLLNGREFQRIRMECGFTRPDFVKYLATKPPWLRGRITKPDSLEDLEANRGARAVPYRYINILRELVGSAAFDFHYKRIVEMRERRKQ